MNHRVKKRLFMTYDKVSVYITTYNRCDRLFRAINSVIKQTYNDFEILVCDDASTDNTETMMTELVKHDNRVRYFRNSTNMGACYSRNVGINNATGKFITGLDDDDEFTDDRLNLFINKWDDKYSFLCANFFEVYPDKKFKHYIDSQERAYNHRNLLYKNIASNQIFTTTEKLRSINGFDKDVKRLQDWDTWLRLAYKHGDFLRLSDATYLMHHDHIINDIRVSTSYSFTNALRELGIRNRSIYGKDEYKCLQYLLSYYDRKLSFIDSVKWGCYQKNVKNILRYFKQKLSKDTKPA